jgi:hypothetical protein
MRESVNASALADTHSNSHILEFYEWLPETRQILRSVLGGARLETEQRRIVMPEEEPCREFDGEAHIAKVCDE